jgi:hypothetical protein
LASPGFLCGAIRTPILKLGCQALYQLCYLSIPCSVAVKVFGGGGKMVIFIIIFPSFKSFGFPITNLNPITKETRRLKETYTQLVVIAPFVLEKSEAQVHVCLLYN